MAYPVIRPLREPLPWPAAQSAQTIMHRRPHVVRTHPPSRPRPQPMNRPSPKYRFRPRNSQIPTTPEIMKSTAWEDAIQTDDHERRITAQAVLGAENACGSGLRFLAHGFDVVVADVLTPSTAAICRRNSPRAGSFTFWPAWTKHTAGPQRRRCGLPTRNSISSIDGTTPIPVRKSASALSVVASVARTAAVVRRFPASARAAGPVHATFRYLAGVLGTREGMRWA